MKIDGLLPAYCSVFAKLANACVGERAFAKATYCLSKINLVETLEGKQCNCIFWSHAGRTVIIAAFGDSTSSGNRPIKVLLRKQWIKPEIPKGKRYL